MARVRFHVGVVGPGHRFLLLQPFEQAPLALATCCFMRKAQGFDALQDQKGAVRAHRRADVAHRFGAHFHRQRRGTEFFPEADAVKGRVGFGQFGKAPALLPSRTVHHRR